MVQAVDRFISEQLDRTSIPGAAVALTHHGHVVHVRGFGHDSAGSPVTSDTPFRIASLTKSFTALAVMQLADRGLLSLDDRVADLVPEFRPADPRAADITVAQVLNQTSGLADRAFNELEGPQPDNHAEAVARLDNTHLVADPGTEWNYHNPNYAVAARVVEVVSGEELNTYLHHDVLLPLGMTSSTSVNHDNSPVEGLVDGHIALYGQQLPLGNPYIFEGGAGGVVSTAADMAQWLVVQTNGGRSASGIEVVSPDALTRMHTSSTSTGYAFGWSVHDRAGEPTRIDHTGNLATYCSYQALLPDSEYGVVLLFNSASVLTTDQTAIYHGIVDMLTGEDLSPEGSSPRAATIDYVLGIMTIAVGLLGVRNVLTARRWATRRLRSPRLRRTRTALRLVPSIAVLAAAATFPSLAALVFNRACEPGRRPPTPGPPSSQLVLVAFIASAATLVARVRLPDAAPAGRS